MKKALLAVLALFAALVGTLATAPAASAYPETTCNLVVEPVNAKPGEPVTVHCTLVTTDDGNGRKAARGAAGSDNTWVVTFAGMKKTGAGDQFTTSFVAPSVTKTTPLTIHAVARNADGTVICDRTVTVVVSPDETDVDGPDLPNTGGPRMIILLAGLALVATGAFAVRRGRKHA